MSASEAIKLAEANKELFTGQHGKEAYNKMMRDLKQHEKDGRAVDFSMSSSDGKTGSLTFGTQTGGNWSMHNASLKGWKNVAEGFNSTDTRDKMTSGGIQMSVYDPKTGKLHEGIGTYDKNGQLQLQVGQESSDIGQNVLAWKNATYELGGLKGTVSTDKQGNKIFTSEGGDKFAVMDEKALKQVTPSGWVHIDGKKSSTDGTLVSGKESSIIVSEGQFKDGATGKYFKGVAHTDSRTGIALVQNNESGEFYKYTWGKRADAANLGIAVIGDVSATSLQTFAKGAGMSDEGAKEVGLYGGAFAKGIPEISAVVRGIKNLKPFKSNPTPAGQPPGGGAPAGGATSGTIIESVPKYVDPRKYNPPPTGGDTLIVK